MQLDTMESNELRKILQSVHGAALPDEPHERKVHTRLICTFAIGIKSVCMYLTVSPVVGPFRAHPT